MAITVTHLTSAYDGVDNTTFTTASVSPTASRWLVIDATQSKGTAPDDPTITGLSLSWTKELTSLDGGSGIKRLTRAYAWTGGAPGSGTISIACGAVNTSAAWVVYEIGGADTSDPFVQTVVSNPSGTGTSVSPTLAAFTDSGNRPLIAACHTANEGFSVDTTPSSYTQIDANNVFGSSPNNSISSAWLSSATDTAPSFTWTTAAPRIGIASEIAVLPAGGGGAMLDPFGMSGLFGA